MIYFDNVRVPAKNIIGQPGVFVYVKEMAMIVTSASYRGHVDWLSFAGDESIFVVEKSSENNEGQLQVTKAVHFLDRYILMMTAIVTRFTNWTNSNCIWIKDWNLIEI